jgi:transcription initiation factor TFIIIB Brf1 subunit/transcription initiation factor TFIIB
MYCDNCGTEEVVKETELGILCDACYLILCQEHFDIIDNPENL